MKESTNRLRRSSRKRIRASFPNYYGKIIKNEYTGIDVKRDCMDKE